MNVSEREILLKAYFHYVPGDKTYKKPVSSGLKPSYSGKNKRRELFVDDLAPPIEKIIRPNYATNLGDTAGPSNIENTETDINKPVENSGQAEDSDMLFNPDCVIGKVYQLVYRKDHKLCPQRDVSVKTVRSNVPGGTYISTS